MEKRVSLIICGLEIIVPTAHDKDSHHRMFNILNVSKDLSVKDFKINESGSLQVQWSEGDHTSYYDPNWLRKNCYTLKNKSKYVSPIDLWNKDLKNEFDTNLYRT